MNEKEKEKLSALLDGELFLSELNATINNVQEHTESESVANRYQLIGDALRGISGANHGFDLSSKVRDELKNEPTVLAPTKRKKVRWLQPMVGGAIAASVTLIALTLLVTKNTVDDQITFQPVSVAAVSPVQKNEKQQWHKMNPQLQSKLNQYLVNHNEFAMPAATGGLLPYSTLVSYDSKQ